MVQLICALHNVNVNPLEAFVLVEEVRGSIPGTDRNKKQLLQTVGDCSLNKYRYLAERDLILFV